jgi:hypothetical protein
MTNRRGPLPQLGQARRAGCAAALACLALALPACRPAAVPQPVSVGGRVLSQGRGVPSAAVVFWPEDDQGRVADAVTNSQGDFQVTCLPGAYKVTVAPFDAGTVAGVEEGGPRGPVEPPERPDIPARYRNQATTGLRIEAPAQGAEGVELVLN